MRIRGLNLPEIQQRDFRRMVRRVSGHKRVAVNDRGRCDDTVEHWKAAPFAFVFRGCYSKSRVLEWREKRIQLL